MEITIECSPKELAELIRQLHAGDKEAAVPPLSTARRHIPATQVGEYARFGGETTLPPFPPGYTVTCGGASTEREGT